MGVKLRPFIPEPQLSSQFAIDAYFPNCSNLQNLNSFCRSVKHDLQKKHVSLVLINDTRGAALETLENLKVKGVETLIIYPLNGKSNYSDYFISCLFGEIHSTAQDFNITEDNVNTIFTFIQFYSIRSLNEDSKFDSESYVDSIHKQLFEKFYFLKT